jgi:hypothetical protein
MSALGPVVLLVVGACASNQDLICRSDERVGVMETLYFGTAKPGGAVTRDEWNTFLRETVTPLFPDGLTSWEAHGQWRTSDGAIEREASYVLHIAHAPREADDLAIQTIMRKYKEDFHQEAVLRIHSRGCLSL